MTNSSCRVAKTNKCQNDGTSGHLGAFVSVIPNGCAKISNRVELEFYRDVYKDTLPISKVIPLYKGVCKLDNQPRIMIENLKDKMRKPRDLDIKIGRYTAYVSELVDSGKSLVQSVIKTSKMRTIDQFSTSETLFYRIVGGSFLDYSRLHIQTLTPDTILNAFFSKDRDHKVRQFMYRELQKIHNAIQNSGYLELVGASILLVYDEENPQKAVVKLIDFAHSRAGLDTEHESKYYALQGINNIRLSILSTK